MQSTLFDTIPGFDWKHLKSDTTTRYFQDTEFRKRLLDIFTRIEDTKQKCFNVVVEGFTSYCRLDHIYCVFPTFIIHYMSYPCIPNWYEFSFHTLGLYGLQYFKTYKISEGKPIHEVLPIFQSFDRSIQSDFERSIQSEMALSKKSITEKCKKEMEEIIEDETQTFEIQKQVLCTELNKYKGIAKNYMKELYDERRAFEKEKRSLETELAKYKGIVENCRKEISAYGF